MLYTATTAFYIDHKTLWKPSAMLHIIWELWTLAAVLLKPMEAYSHYLTGVGSYWNFCVS